MGSGGKPGEQIRSTRHDPAMSVGGCQQRNNLSQICGCLVLHCLAPLLTSYLLFESHPVVRQGG